MGGTVCSPLPLSHTTTYVGSQQGWLNTPDIDTKLYIPVWIHYQWWCVYYKDTSGSVLLFWLQIFWVYENPWYDWVLSITPYLAQISPPTPVYEWNPQV